MQGLYGEMHPEVKNKFFPFDMKYNYRFRYWVLITFADMSRAIAS